MLHEQIEGILNSTVVKDAYSIVFGHIKQYFHDH